jgi:N-acyl-D-amino-acid deacylase
VSRGAPSLWLAACLLVGVGACEAPQDAMLIVDVTIVDGTGAPGYQGAVRVRDGIIVDVGALDATPGDSVVEGTGMVLAPGFIDTHSHHDGGLLDSREATAVVSQGITTIVVGQDGGSRFPLADFFSAVSSTPPAINVASYTGHGRIRREVLGDDYRRPATDAEIDRMIELLTADLEAGSLGLSTGLEYDPGIYSEPDEVIRLARVAGEAGGRYISHMRSEDRALFDAVDEIINIGREADVPVQISHMKLAMKSLWGQADDLVQKLEEARVSGVDITADVYPYQSWQSTMTVLFPDREYTREAAAFALDQLAPPDGMIIGRYTPERSYEGQTLAEIAEARGKDAVTTYLALIDAVHGPDAPDGASESILARSMAAEDITTLLQWEHTNVCTDGGLAGPHPRGFGTFTRILGQYVREDGALTVEDAVHRMTQLAAQHVGITGRGEIAVGMAADLVLFDPATVMDRATFESPHELSVGIDAVWVGGELVWNGQTTTGAMPGVLLRRTGT